MPYAAAIRRTQFSSPSHSRGCGCSGQRRSGALPAPGKIVTVARARTASVVLRAADSRPLRSRRYRCAPHHDTRGQTIIANDVSRHYRSRSRPVQARARSLPLHFLCRTSQRDLHSCWQQSSWQQSHTVWAITSTQRTGSPGSSLRITSSQDTGSRSSARYAITTAKHYPERSTAGNGLLMIRKTWWWCLKATSLTDSTQLPVLQSQSVRCASVQHSTPPKTADPQTSSLPFDVSPRPRSASVRPDRTYNSERAAIHPFAWGANRSSGRGSKAPGAIISG